MAFASIEPFGAQADHLGHAITASAVANSVRTKAPWAKVEDFMPKFDKQDQTPDQMVQIAEMFTLGLGGKDLREENDG